MHAAQARTASLALEPQARASVRRLARANSTPEDRDRILTMWAALHAESRYADFTTFSPKKVRATLEALLASPRGIVLLGDPPRGFMWGGCAAYAFADESYSTNAALYVEPATRGSFLAVSLIRAYERAARAQGVSEILIDVNSGVSTERTARLYERLGYRAIGGLFSKRA